MTLDVRALRSWVIPPIAQSYAERDTMLYALGVRVGYEPTDDRQLRFVYESALQALPTMAGILGYPGFWLADPRFGIDWLRTVHGEQSIVLHRPLSPSGSVVGHNRLAAVVDKGPERGALVITERTLTDAASGTSIATLLHTAFCRGDGGFSQTGEPGDEPLPSLEPMPDSPPEAVVDLPTRPESALIYRLSGDHTALHVDPAVARRAGFPRPILHGMATFGVCGHAILRAACEYEPARLHSISGRFASPVYPGETVRTEIWTVDRDPGWATVRFRARVVERGVVVLDHGRARIAS